VAVYSERVGNSFGPNGFSIGSSRHVSSSKYPKSYCMKITSQMRSRTCGTLVSCQRDRLALTRGGHDCGLLAILGELLESFGL
jgi:hypothetical protein